MRQAVISVGTVVAVPVLSANREGVTAILRADPANTASVYLGDPKVVPAGVGLRPGQVVTMILGPGQDLYGISTAAGQQVLVLSAPSPSEFGSIGASLVEGSGVQGTPAGGVVTVQGALALGALALGQATLINSTRTGVAMPFAGIGVAYPLGVTPYLTDGNSAADSQRTPAVFKPLAAAVITAETAIWTPAAGKKFRLMGYVITQGVVTGAITLKDNTGGTTILVIPPNTIGVVQASPSLGNGILSAAANNVLTATGVATETITGYVFGTEE